MIHPTLAYPACEQAPGPQERGNVVECCGNSSSLRNAGRRDSGNSCIKVVDHGAQAPRDLKVLSSIEAELGESCTAILFDVEVPLVTKKT